MSEVTKSPPGIAVIGCGAWGRNHVRTFAALGALRAVHDASPIAAKAASESASVPEASIEEILSDATIDGIVLASPDATHAPLATLTLEAGKHVLVEKPMATSVADGQALLALAREKNRVLMAGHILHYHPGFQRLRRMVGEGDLGTLHHIASKRLHLARGAPRHALWDLAPHDISMVLALTGCMPQQVKAQAASPRADTPPQLANLMLSFADGLSADIAISAIHPVKLHQITVTGSEAHGVFDDTRGWQEKVLVIRPGLDATGDPEISPVPLTEAEPLKAEANAFLSAIAGGPVPPSCGAEGQAVVHVLEAAQNSLDSGDTVVLDRTARRALET